MRPARSSRQGMVITSPRRRQPRLGSFIAPITTPSHWAAAPPRGPLVTLPRRPDGRAELGDLVGLPISSPPSGSSNSVVVLTIRHGSINNPPRFYSESPTAWEVGMSAELVPEDDSLELVERFLAEELGALSRSPGTVEHYRRNLTRLCAE